MKKSGFTILIVFMTGLLVACGGEQAEQPVSSNGVSEDPTLPSDTPTNNPNEFELAPKLAVNSTLEGLVVMEVSVEEDNILEETWVNNSDREIILGHPSLEYFNGENWKIVPVNEKYAFVDLAINLLPNEQDVFTLTLSAFHHSEEGLFRVRRKVYTTEQFPNFPQDVVAEFTLE